MRYRLAKWTHGLLNGGTPLLRMVLQWLHLWVLTWRAAYLSDPHGGRNYVEAIAPTVYLPAGLLAAQAPGPVLLSAVGRHSTTAEV